MSDPYALMPLTREAVEQRVRQYNDRYHKRPEPEQRSNPSPVEGAL